MKQIIRSNNVTHHPSHWQPWLPSEDARNWPEHRLAHTLSLERLVNCFAPVTLHEMDDVALLDRIDTKFVITVQQFTRALVAMQPYYRVLSVQGQRLNHYRTIYFDTPNFDLYNLHVNGRADRFKVRSREYLDSKVSYLEVKHRTRKNRTIKERIATDQPVVWMNADMEEWLQSVFPYDSRLLEPKLGNTFTRITLVGKPYAERVTLDVDLAFFTQQAVVNMNSLVVTEVKHAGRDSASPFMSFMNSERIRAQRFSKYCTGASLLYAHLKKNSLKPKIRRIEKLLSGVVDE